MKIILKKIILLSLVSLTLLSTASCTKEESDSKENNGEVTISMSWWGDETRNEATLEAIELFESKHSNITVETEYGSWNEKREKTINDIKNKKSADLMQVNYNWLSSLSYDGTGFYNLQTLNLVLNLSGFSEEIIQYGKRNGILNAIPVSMTGRSLFYNENTYKKLGVSIPKTWDDLFSAAKIFKKNNCYPLNLDNGSGFTAWYISVVYIQQKTGKQFITADGEIGFSVEDIADALTFFKSLEDAGITPTIEAQSNTSGALYENKDFLNGKIAGICEWGSSVGKYENAMKNDKLVLGDLPVLENAKMTGWFAKPSLLFAINKDTKYPYETALLLDFLVNNYQCAKILGTTRGIPACNYALDSIKTSGQLKGNTFDATNQILNSNPCVISPYMEDTELQGYYHDAIEAVSYELSTPKQAAQGLYANMLYTLKRIK